MPLKTTPLDRLKRKTGKGSLWVYILALLKSKPRYAYEIRSLVKEKFGFTIGNVTAYMVLYKLELSGHVKASWEIKGKRQRKYYTITSAGKKTLSEGVEYLSGLTKKLLDA